MGRHGDSEALLQQLARNSAPYQDPLLRVRWPLLDSDPRPWLPDAALSLHGLPEFEALPEEQRRALSRYEFLHIIEGALWLEALFMVRIARTLVRRAQPLAENIYHLHELREEAGHSLVFLELQKRTGPLVPAGAYLRWDLPNLFARLAPFSSVAFWTAVLMGEEIPDRLNRFIRRHRDEINPAVFDIVTLHMIDEARHIAHARDTVEQGMARLPAWRKHLYRPLVNRAFAQFVRRFFYPTAQVYELAGLAPGHVWAARAWNNPRRIEFVQSCVGSSMRTLRGFGIPLAWR